MSLVSVLPAPLGHHQPLGIVVALHILSRLVARLHLVQRVSIRTESAIKITLKNKTYYYNNMLLSMEDTN